MQVKISTRRAFDRHELAAHHLVRLLHGLARMPRYAPNPGWLLALAQEVRQQMQQLTPGEEHSWLDGWLDQMDGRIHGQTGHTVMKPE